MGNTRGQTLVKFSIHMAQPWSNSEQSRGTVSIGAHASSDQAYADSQLYTFCCKHMQLPLAVACCASVKPAYSTVYGS